MRKVYKLVGSPGETGTGPLQSAMLWAGPAYVELQNIRTMAIIQLCLATCVAGGGIAPERRVNVQAPPIRTAVSYPADQRHPSLRSLILDYLETKNSSKTNDPGGQLVGQQALLWSVIEIHFGDKQQKQMISATRGFPSSMRAWIAHGGICLTRCTGASIEGSLWDESACSGANSQKRGGVGHAQMDGQR